MLKKALYKSSNLANLNAVFACWIFIIGFVKSKIEVRQDTPEFLTAKLWSANIIASGIDWLNAHQALPSEKWKLRTCYFGQIFESKLLLVGHCQWSVNSEWWFSGAESRDCSKSFNWKSEPARSILVSTQLSGFIYDPFGCKFCSRSIQIHNRDRSNITAMMEWLCCWIRSAALHRIRLRTTEQPDLFRCLIERLCQWMCSALVGSLF